MAKNTPLHLSRALIYQIFPRYFSEKGDFRSIVPHLDRIRDLNTSIIWLTPIHPISSKSRKGTFGSPYAIYDYRAVNPDFGTKEDLAFLADEIHKRGMKLMIDVVYNHTGVGSVLSQEHPEWFYHKNGEISRKFEEWSDVWDLDFSHAPLWDYLIESLAQWVALGVDGFRCDVATMVPAAFWVEARRRLNKEKDIIWLAECTHLHFTRFLRSNAFTASTDSELFEAFDMLYDYDGYEIIERFRVGAASLREYMSHVYAQTLIYPRSSLKMRFLENHDQPRAAATYRGRENLENWTAFYLFLPGPSLVYAGQEICETVQPDLFETGCINWSSQIGDFELMLRKLIALSQKIKTDDSIYYHDEIGEGVFRIRWINKTGEYWVYLNLENRIGKMRIGENVLLTNIITGEVQQTDTLLMENFPLVYSVKR